MAYADSCLATSIYNAGSRLTQVDDTADPHRPLTRTYDPLDRLLTETTSLGTVTYSYDTAGRRTSMTVSGQAPVNYTYDQNARLRTITQVPLNAAAIDYDAANRRTLLTLPNGVSTEYVYDLGSRLSALVYRNTLGPLGDLTYQYDAAGNRISVGGSFARMLVPETIASATYDAGNRQLAFGPTAQTFDDNGNLLTQTDPSGTITYTWDARNRLTGLAGPSVNASFAYDALGRRAQKTIDGVTTAFRYDGLDVAQESSGGSNVTYLRTLSIDEALARTEAVDTVHYLGDALGSSVALTTAAGASATTYIYEPFGRTEASGSPSGNAFRFTGREDDGTGLYYYRARYYDPRRGRFVGEDPIGLVGGINSFAYVRNAPLGRTDALGLMEDGAAGGLGGVGAGLDPLTFGVGGFLLVKIMQDAARHSSREFPFPADTQPNCPPEDPCRDLLEKMNRHMDWIDRKYTQSATDPWDLYNKAHSTNPGGALAGKGTWGGHIRRNQDLTHSLINMVDRAIAMKCPIPPRALLILSRGWPRAPFSK